VTDTFITHTREALDAKIEQRMADMEQAAAEGRHFWLAGAIYRVDGPVETALLDHENLCGYTPIHCAICGVLTNDDPVCPGL
jgi:hypothetical protein